MVCTEVKNYVLLLSAKPCCRVWKVCQGTWVAVHLGASHIISVTLNFIQPGEGTFNKVLQYFLLIPFSVLQRMITLLVLTKQMTAGLCSPTKLATLCCDWLVAFSPPGFVWAHSGSDLPCCVCDLQHLCEWIQWQDLYHLGPEPADIHKPTSCPWGKPLFCCHQQFNSKIFIYHLSSDVSMNISW